MVERITLLLCFWTKRDQQAGRTVNKVHQEPNPLSIPSPHLIVRLHQDLVVFAERHQEHDGGDVLKAVDPLPPFWPLTSHIHHPETKVPV